MNDSRVVLITGVSRGLGLAMVRQFTERGHTVLGCARSRESIEQLSARHGSPHSFRRLDVRDVSAVQAWSNELLERYDAPDLVLNNAAIINQPASLWEVEPTTFSELIDVNLKGVFHVLHAFLPAMIQRGNGIIVNFSSGWGRSTSPEVAPYCCSKWGIEGLTRALADELPNGLAAVALNPGIIHTEMLETCFGESASGYPTPKAWARRCVPFLLELSGKDNGRALTAPNG